MVQKETRISKMISPHGHLGQIGLIQNHNLPQATGYMTLKINKGEIRTRFNFTLTLNRISLNSQKQK